MKDNWFCSCCNIEVTNRELNKECRPTDWLLAFVTWNEKKAVVCSRCYKEVYRDWKPNGEIEE